VHFSLIELGEFNSSISISPNSITLSLPLERPYYSYVCDIPCVNTFSFFLELEAMQEDVGLQLPTNLVAMREDVGLSLPTNLVLLLECLSLAFPCFGSGVP